VLDAGVARRLTASLPGGKSGRVTTTLTTRERDVVRLLGAGEPNKRIAVHLGISERTARTHVSNILAKLGLTSRTQAALWATRQGFVDRPGDDA
jgi:DNA-binding NarL/FixJ family response regulator